ncbi:hypothetical protein ACFWG0_06405 [Streptomyces yangpuensis]|uniref:hypothetical protein n=1 Tax=Streptomyces yangpuensis TaxID=1648182 RepID=UPI003667311D
MNALAIGAILLDHHRRPHLPQNTEGIRALLLDRFAAWSPRLRQMLRHNDGPYVDRPLYALHGAAEPSKADRGAPRGRWILWRCG